MEGHLTKKMYHELGWESLTNRRWYKQMCLFYKIINNKTPNYLKLFLRDTISPRNDFQRPLFTRTKKYMTSFFPSCVHSWNTILSADQRNLKTISTFKLELIKVIRPQKTKNFGIDDSNALKHITQLRLGLNSLRANKFRHNFKDTDDPLCVANDGIEDAYHFLLDCTRFLAERKILFREIFVKTGLNLLLQPISKIEEILLYGDISLSAEANKTLLNETIKYISSTKRLESF